MLRSLQYAARLSDIYPEGDRGAPLEEEIVAQGRTLTHRLVGFWWEDNPKRRSVWVTYRPQVFGVALTLLTLGVDLVDSESQEGKGEDRAARKIAARKLGSLPDALTPLPSVHLKLGQ